MRSLLPERSSISAVSAPVAVLLAVVVRDWSQWASAAALVLPALLLVWSGARPHIVGSYLLAVALTALAFTLGVLSGHTPIAGISQPLVVAPIVGALLAIWGQLLLGAVARRWSVAMGATLAGVGAVLLLSLAPPPSAEELGKGPEKLAEVPACNETCKRYVSPSGHSRCARVTHTDEVLAVRDCEASSGFLNVTAGGRFTSVLVSREDRVVIWREPGGRLLLEQGGLPIRGLSPEGAVMLSPSFSLSPHTPAYVLQVAGASLLLVALALVLVLRSLRAQRLLAGGLVGHVEAGRFFPSDGHLTPLAVAGVHTNGPALLFGGARRTSYRDGGGSPVRVLRGTLRDLVSSHHVRRFRACAFALCALLFAWLGVAADLARLH